MILQTLSTVLLLATAQTGTKDQGLSDAELLKRFHALNLRMADLGDLVRTKTTNASVKTFATALANDHRRMDRILLSIAEGMKITLGAPQWDREDIADNRAFADAFNKMKTLTPDKNYDKAFLDMMLEDHNQQLNILQTEKNRTSNGRLRDHMNDFLTMELKHRNRALELEGKRPPAAS